MSNTAFIETEAMQVGEAVVDILNDGTIAIPQAAKRDYLPGLALADAGDASVIVAVTGRSLRRQQRSSVVHVPGTLPSRKVFDRKVKVEIGVNKKFANYEDVQSADPMMKVCEQIADLFSAIRIEASSSLHAYPENEGSGDAAQHAPIYDPDNWKKHNQFTGIVTINYRLVDVA